MAEEPADRAGWAGSVSAGKLNSRKASWKGRQLRFFGKAAHSENGEACRRNCSGDSFNVAVAGFWVRRRNTEHDNAPGLRSKLERGFNNLAIAIRLGNMVVSRQNRHQGVTASAMPDVHGSERNRRSGVFALGLGQNALACGRRKLLAKRG